MPAEVTVVIPTSGRPTLRRAVDSALAQQEVTLEVIVVDNSAHPTSIDFDDPRVTVIRSDPALRGNGARQAGIRSARSDTIALLDDDDWWQPRKLIEQLSLLRRKSLRANDMWILTCAVEERDPAGTARVVPRVHPPDEIHNVAEYIARRNHLRSDGQQLQSSTLVFPRELGLRQPFVASMEVHQDWAWVIAAQQQCGATILYDPRPMTIRAMESPGSIAANIDWRKSLNWSHQMLRQSSSRAKGDFALTIPLDRATRARDWQGIRACVEVGVREGRPGIGAWVFLCVAVVRMVARRGARSK